MQPARRKTTLLHIIPLIKLFYYDYFMKFFRKVFVMYMGKAFSVPFAFPVRAAPMPDASVSAISSQFFQLRKSGIHDFGSRSVKRNRNFIILRLFL